MNNIVGTTVTILMDVDVSEANIVIEPIGMTR